MNLPFFRVPLRGTLEASVILKHLESFQCFAEASSDTGTSATPHYRTQMGSQWTLYDNLQ